MDRLLAVGVSSDHAFVGGLVPSATSFVRACIRLLTIGLRRGDTRVLLKMASPHGGARPGITALSLGCSETSPVCAFHAETELQAGRIAGGQLVLAPALRRRDASAAVDHARPEQLTCPRITTMRVAAGDTGPRLLVQRTMPIVSTTPRTSTIGVSAGKTTLLGLIEGARARLSAQRGETARVPSQRLAVGGIAGTSNRQDWQPTSNLPVDLPFARSQVPAVPSVHTKLAMASRARPRVSRRRSRPGLRSSWRGDRRT